MRRTRKGKNLKRTIIVLSHVEIHLVKGRCTGRRAWRAADTIASNLEDEALIFCGSFGGNVSLDLLTRGEEEAVVWEDAVLGVEPGVEHTLVLQKNQAKSEISQRFTWFPQSCWHSSSVSTFSWNAFYLFKIWQSGQNFSKLKLSGCIYLQKMHKYCMSYIYLLQCAYAKIGVVLSDDGECGEGGGTSLWETKTGKLAQNRCSFPSFWSD